MNTKEPLPLFDSITKKNQIKKTSDIIQSDNPLSLKQDITQALLNQLFPEQKREDKTIKQSRAILGSLSEKISSDELQRLIVLLQYLTESWLDRYEKEIFKGMTLNELLNNG